MARAEVHSDDGEAMSRQSRAETPSVPIAVRVSQEERDRIEKAAKVNRQSLSQFQRDALLDRADQTLDDAHS